MFQEFNREKEDNSPALLDLLFECPSLGYCIMRGTLRTSLKAAVKLVKHSNF